MKEQQQKHEDRPRGGRENRDGIHGQRRQEDEEIHPHNRL
jgi:hypothetical protein